MDPDSRDGKRRFEPKIFCSGVSAFNYGRTMLQPLFYSGVLSMLDQGHLQRTDPVHLNQSIITHGTCEMSIDELVALTVISLSQLSSGTASGGGHGLHLFTTGNSHALGLDSNVKRYPHGLLSHHSGRWVIVVVSRSKRVPLHCRLFPLGHPLSLLPRSIF